MSSEWRQEPLGRVATLQRGFDLPYRKRTRGDVPVVTSSGFGDTHGVAAVKGPGVVTGRYGTIGEVFYVPGDFWPLNTTLFVRDFHGNDPVFVSYLLRTIDFQSHSGKSGVPGINRNDIHELAVRVPCPDEQRRIASALSDIDALLAKLEQLIAKKRDLKQAAMQQLLTGRTRLEGFAAPWQQIQLGRLGSFGKGRGLAKDDLARGGELPAVPYTAIYTDFGQIASMMDVAGRVSRSRAEVTVNKPSLLIASSSNMRENIGKAVAICIDDEVAVGGDVLIFRTQADVRFLSYLLSTEAHRRRVVALSQGSTIRHVYAATFSAYEVELPSRDEQVAIADALADIDAELAALEARREKTRQLKQGMMQTLLTGRIRLV